MSLPHRPRISGLPRWALALGVVLLMALSACTALAAAHAHSTATPSLPVPDPSAQVAAGSPGADPTSKWNVVALGDSVTSGGPCGCTPFPQLYGSELARVRGVVTTTRNFGQGGQTSGGLLGILRDDSSPMTAAVKDADIDLVTIGANDFGAAHASVTQGQCLANDNSDCVQDTLASMTANVEAIVNRIHELRGSQPTTVLVTGYWNVFEDGAVARKNFPQIGVRATQRLTQLANSGIEAAAKGTGATYVDLYSPFEGPPTGGDATSLLGPDGDHPNQAGQQLIADRLVAAGLPGLSEG